MNFYCQKILLSQVKEPEKRFVLPERNIKIKFKKALSQVSDRQTVGRAVLNSHLESIQNQSNVETQRSQAAGLSYAIDSLKNWEKTPNIRPKTRGPNNFRSPLSKSLNLGGRERLTKMDNTCRTSLQRVSIIIQKQQDEVARADSEQKRFFKKRNIPFSGMSTLVKSLNQSIRDKIQSINTHKNESTDDFEDASKTFVQDICDTEIQIKEMKTVLERLGPQNENEQIIEKQKQIHLIKAEPVTFKIPCEGLLTPCTVKINYPAHDHELTLFVSQVFTKPTVKYQEMLLYSPKHFRVNSESEGRKKFFKPFIYLTFVSETSKSIQVTTKFGLPKIEAAVRPDKLQTYIKNDERIKNYLEEWLISTAPLQKNLEVTPLLRTSSPTYVHSLKTQSERHDDALKKREQKQKLVIEKKELLLRKWEIVRQKRQKMIQKLEGMKNRKIYAEFWLRKILIHLAYKKFDSKMKEKMKEKIFQNKLLFMIRRMQWIYRIKKKFQEQKFKKNYYQAQVRKVLVVTAPVLTFIQREPSGQVMYNFLNRALFNKNFELKFRTIYTAINFIQTALKGRELSVDTKRKFIANYIWPEQLDCVRAIFMIQAKKSKVAQNVINLLKEIPVEVKMRVISLFLVRQNLQHCIRFFHWIITKRANKISSDTIDVFKLNIQLRLVQLYEIDKILFTEVEIPYYGIGSLVSRYFGKDYGLADDEDLIKKYGWNSLARLQIILFPIRKAAGKSEFIKMKVDDVQYSFLVGQKMPSFTYLPSSMEIFQRLIIRAAFAKGVWEFKLKKSHY